jgi:hypothetical protein
MVSIKRFKLRFILVSVLLTFLIGGCAYDPHYHEPHGHAHYHYDPYDYHYYPGVRVYFHFSTGHYYYHHRNRWVRARVLPPHIYIHPHDRVRIKIKSKEPYLKHHEHRKIYAPKPRREYKADKRSSLREHQANRKKHEDYKRNRDRPARQR